MGGAYRWTVALIPGDLGGRIVCNRDSEALSKGDRWGGGRKWFRGGKRKIRKMVVTGRVGRIENNVNDTYRV